MRSARIQVFQGHLVAELVLILENRQEDVSALYYPNAFVIQAILPDWGLIGRNQTKEDLSPR